MYPETLTAPMKAELTSAGLQDLSSPEQVDSIINEKGTTMIVVNSVCGCAAGAARPGVLAAIAHEGKKPNHIGTVFAGVDTAAVAKARAYMLPFPPSSPSIALFKDGKLVHFVERHHIEGRSAQMIAQNLLGAFEEYC